MRLIHGECLEEMDKLIEEGIKVDFIITDLPYGTTKCKWDNLIDFKEMWKRIDKLTNPNTAVALFGTEPFSSGLRMSNIKNFRYDWIWEKVVGTGFLNANKMPLKGFEIVSIFYKHLPVYNPQKTAGTPFTDNRDNPEGERQEQEYLGTKPKPSKQKNNGDRHPKGIVRISSRNNNPIHPTQKPVKLLEYFIKTYSNEGETVLDFTMGSGSTGVACKNTNRHFIGIELDDKYFKLGTERIKGELR